MPHHRRGLVAAEVVHHHHVLRTQRRGQAMLAVARGDLAVDRPVDYRSGGLDHPARADGREQGGDLLMAVGPTIGAALPARAASDQAGEVALGPGFAE